MRQASKTSYIINLGFQRLSLEELVNEEFSLKKNRYSPFPLNNVGESIYRIAKNGLSLPKELPLILTNRVNLQEFYIFPLFHGNDGNSRVSILCCSTAIYASDTTSSYALP